MIRVSVLIFELCVWPRVCWMICSWKFYELTIGWIQAPSFVTDFRARAFLVGNFLWLEAIASHGEIVTPNCLERGRFRISWVCGKVVFFFLLYRGGYNSMRNWIFENPDQPFNIAAKRSPNFISLNVNEHRWNILRINKCLGSVFSPRKKKKRNKAFRSVA